MEFWSLLPKLLALVFFRDVGTGSWQKRWEAAERDLNILPLHIYIIWIFNNILMQILQKYTCISCEMSIFFLIERGERIVSVWISMAVSGDFYSMI